MNVASVDANVLLRALLSQNDEQSESARSLLERPGMQFRVSDAALIEFVFVLDHHYKLTRLQINEMVQALLTVGSLLLRRDVVTAALRCYLAHPKLSFEDCLMAEQARDQNALPLFTFDKKLAQQHDCAELIEGVNGCM